MNALVTGFGPFGNIEDNPSGILARTCGREFALLEVSFDAVDEWMASLDPASFDTLLLMGVNAGATAMNLEMIAHNRIGRTRDVRGTLPESKVIRPDGPWRLYTTLWDRRVGTSSYIREHEGIARSNNAGTYLCNYSYYLALYRFWNKRVGFLHVPPFEVMPCERQQQILQTLLSDLDR